LPASTGTKISVTVASDIASAIVRPRPRCCAQWRKMKANTCRIVAVSRSCDESMLFRPGFMRGRLLFDLGGRRQRARRRSGSTAVAATRKSTPEGGAGFHF
jgi:hypothetical protein